MFIHLQSQEFSTSKFWKATVSGVNLVIESGRVGRAGFERTVAFADADAAWAEAKTRAAKKLNDGFTEVERVGPDRKPTPTAPPADAVSELTATVASSRPTLILRRARLFARLHRPDQLVPGEAYDVDLARQHFEIRWGDVVVSEGHAQLIATYLPAKEEWLWGDHNPSVDSQGTSDIAPRLDALGPLKALRRSPSFLMKRDMAHDVADWIAEATQFEAMYPAVVGSAIAFVALTFVRHRGVASDSPATWCIGCGKLPSEVTTKIIAGPDGRAICASCAVNPVDIARDAVESRPHLLTDSEEPVTAPLADVLCALCVTRRPRLFLPETAICYSCARIVGEILADSNN